MLDWMKQAPQAVKLIDDDGTWCRSKVRNYLTLTEWFLKLLMLGISLDSIHG